MNIGSIFVSLGFKTNTKDLKMFDNGIKELRKNLLITTTAFTGATYALKKFVDSSTTNAASLVNFNRQTGLSIDKLNQFAQVGQTLSSGLNVENITNDILNLEKSIARIKIGQGSIRPFQMLGIDIHGKDAFSVLEQLRTNIQGISDVQATILLEDLGLNPNFLQVLKLSREEFDKLSKNNFLKAGEAKTIDQLSLKMRGLSTAFVNLKNQAIVKLAPYLTDLINKTFKWLNTNGQKITKTIAEMAKWVGIFVTGIGRAVGLMVNFIENIAGVDNGLKILAAGFALVTLSFSPFLLGLVAILLLLEDIAVWKMGGESLFGDFYDAVSQIPNIETLLGIGGALAAVTLLTGGMSKLVGVVFALGKKLGVAVAAFLAIRKLGEWLEEFFGGPLGQFLKSGANILAGAAAGGLLAGPGGAVVGAGAAAINEIAGKEIMEFGKATVDFFKSKFSNNNTLNSTNNVNLTINAQSDDAQDIANAVKNVLPDILNPAVNNLNNAF